MNAATNQLTGYSYDANGNLTTTGYGWDAENRMSYATWGGIQYAYDSKNKRVWTANYTCPGGFCGPGYGWQFQSETVFFYGVDGKRLASYTPQVQYSSGTPQSIYYLIGEGRVYFKSKYIGNANTSVTAGGTAIGQDRAGSVGKYFPYGEERNNPQIPNDTVKFATYTRDSATGLDYADQRYYTGGLGRFISPDPYHASGGPSDPSSWNPYSYVQGDPANYFDLTGRVRQEDNCGPGWVTDASLTGPCEDPPPMGGDGNGGGLGPPPPPPPDADDFLPKERQRARDALSKTKCFGLLGFATAKAAQDWFDRTITFHEGSYGRLHLIGPHIPATDPAPANTLGYGQININTDYNWADFSKVTTDTGATENYLGDINAALHTNMTSEQLGALIIIHELGHQNTAPKQPSNAENAAEKIAIYNNCIK